VPDARYLIATDFILGKKLIAAAVVYSSSTEEPSFSYTLHGRSRTGFLYRRGDSVPPSLYAALNEYVRDTAVSWALVTAHAQCSPEVALELAVVRSVERWMCRQAVMPSLSDTCVMLSTRKILTDLPPAIQQIPSTKDWHTASARALCRYRASKEQ